MRELQCVVVVLSLITCLCSAYKDSLKIGAFFNNPDSAEDNEIAFKYAIQRYIHVNNLGVSFTGHTQHIPHTKIFSTNQIVCNTTKAKRGVVAIFGPQESRTAAITESICSKLEIPYIQISWQPLASNPSLMTVNFYPAADLLADGFATIVRHLNWRSYAFVYQEEEALIRLQRILKIADVRGNHVMVRQLTHLADYREIFRDIKSSGIQEIILDCKAKDIIKILKQAKYMGLLTSDNSYLLTSLDAHTLDYSSLQTNANITMVRLFDPSNEDLMKHYQSWEAGETKNERPLTMLPETIETEAVLIIDAVNWLMETIYYLDMTEKIEPRPMDCDDVDIWDDGLRITAFMKRHKIRHPITEPIDFDNFGQRTDFSLRVLELGSDAIKATWRPIYGNYLNITTAFDNVQEESNDSIKIGIREKISRELDLTDEAYTNEANSDGENPQALRGGNVSGASRNAGLWYFWVQVSVAVAISIGIMY